MKNKELLARSIELAERSLRLRDRAPESSTKEGLHAAANELIFLNNSDRFYDAQTELEKQNKWLEDQRSLAHELNVADREIRGTTPIESSEVFKTLEDWARTFLQSNDSEATSIGEQILSSLAILNNDALGNKEKKESLTYILGVIEVFLEHSAAKQVQEPEERTIDEAVVFMRLIRDNILVIRQLAYDENELLNNYQHEGEQVSNLTVARHTIDEFYLNRTKASA